MLGDKEITIDCYGYGDYSKFLSIKVKKKLNNIFFRKFDKNLRNKIKNYDILLHLSKREGLPVSVMECLSESLPVICYDIRGNNDLVQHKYNGFFVNSYQDVVSKISYLNLEDKIFYKMKVNAFKSIKKEYLESQINLNLYKIFKNYIKTYGCRPN
jgi:glycosyltransferase involved in cell wall biosynthesis